MVKLFRIDTEKCTACEKCVKVCPQGVFEMGEENGKVTAIISNIENCDHCGKCFSVCADHAIELRNDDDSPFQRVVAIDKDKCEACETCIGVCPEHNFEIIEEDGKLFAKVKNADLCICDGHCSFSCKAKSKAQILETEPQNKKVILN